MDTTEYGGKGSYEDTPLLNTGVFLNSNTTTADIVIDNIRTTEIEGEKKLVLDVIMQGSQYAWIMNVVNVRILNEKFGTESDGWAGKIITVNLEKTDYAGDRVNCLRVI